MGQNIEMIGQPQAAPISVEKLHPYLVETQSRIILHFLEEKRFQFVDEVEAEITRPDFHFPGFGKRALYNLKDAIAKTREEASCGKGLVGLEKAIRDQIIINGLKMTSTVDRELKQFIRFLALHNRL